MHCQNLQALNEHLSKVRKNQKIVFTNGCFDILHSGHVHYLNEAKSCGDILVVGMNSDSSVKELKGAERPLQNEEDRSFILSNLKAVDFTVIFAEQTPMSLIESIRPDVLVKGGDWAIDQIVGSKFVLGLGGEVRSLSFVEGRSTTSLVEKIKKL